MIGPFRKKRLVFISSTSSDLAAWRSRVAEALRRRGLQVLSMEDFPALASTGVVSSVDMVARCDALFGIYARRYGTRSPDGRSITETEFDEATRKKMPRFCFFLDPTLAPPVLGVSDEPEDMQRFRLKIERLVTPKQFSTLDELILEAGRAADEYMQVELRRRRWRLRWSLAILTVICLSLCCWLWLERMNFYTGWYHEYRARLSLMRLAHAVTPEEKDYDLVRQWVLLSALDGDVTPAHDLAFGYHAADEVGSAGNILVSAGLGLTIAGQKDRAQDIAVDAMRLARFEGISWGSRAWASLDARNAFESPELFRQFEGIMSEVLGACAVKGLDKNEQDDFLDSVAWAQAFRGETTIAVEVSNCIQKASLRSRSLLRVGRILLTLGKPGAHLALLQSKKLLEDSSEYDSSISLALARALVDARQSNEARAFARKMAEKARSPRMRGIAKAVSLANAAQLSAIVGELQVSRQLADESDSELSVNGLHRMTTNTSLTEAEKTESWKAEQWNALTYTLSGEPIRGRFFLFSNDPADRPFKLELLRRESLPIPNRGELDEFKLPDADELADPFNRSLKRSLYAEERAAMHRYRDARTTADSCARPIDKIRGYVAILRERMLQRRPALAWLFREREDWVQFP